LVVLILGLTPQALCCRYLFTASPFPGDRSDNMKFFFLIALIAAFFPASLRAQQSANTSVCLRDTPPGVMLNI
jgi:hypothetical protein